MSGDASGSRGKVLIARLGVLFEVQVATVDVVSVVPGRWTPQALRQDPSARSGQIFIVKQLASTEPHIAQAAVHMVVVIHIGDSNSNRLRHLSTPYIGESLDNHGYHLQKHCAMIA